MHSATSVLQLASPIIRTHFASMAAFTLTMRALISSTNCFACSSWPVGTPYITCHLYQLSQWVLGEQRQQNCSIASYTTLDSLLTMLVAFTMSSVICCQGFR